MLCITSPWLYSFHNYRFISLNYSPNSPPFHHTHLCQSPVCSLCLLILFSLVRRTLTRNTASRKRQVAALSGVLPGVIWTWKKSFIKSRESTRKKTFLIISILFLLYTMTQSVMFNSLKAKKCLITAIAVDDQLTAITVIKPKTKTKLKRGIEQWKEIV